MIRCDSGTDSIVWMEEEIYVYFTCITPEDLFGCILFRR